MKCVLVGSRYFGAPCSKRCPPTASISCVVAPAADDRLALAAAAGRARPRAGQSEDRSRRGDRRRHRAHRRRTYACARQQRGARALAPGRRLAIIRRCCRAIAASRRSSGRSSKAIRLPAARSITWPTAGTRARSPRRTGASSARRIGARAVGARAGADGPQAFDASRAPRARAWRVPSYKQDERYATRAPMIKRTVVLTEEKQPTATSLVVTVIGPDRPGIVSLLSDRAQGFGANWAAAAWRASPASSPAWCTSRCRARTPMRSPPPLRGLESADLKIMIEKSEARRSPPGGAGSSSSSSATTVPASCATWRAPRGARHQHRGAPHRDRERRDDRRAPSRSRRSFWCRRASARRPAPRARGAGQRDDGRHRTRRSRRLRRVAGADGGIATGGA